jgi:hypothetical protein
MNPARLHVSIFLLVVDHMIASAKAELGAGEAVKDPGRT